jgi:hypothetical protein
MDECREQRTEKTEGGQPDPERIDDKRAGEVLPDDAPGAAGDGEGCSVVPRADIVGEAITRRPSLEIGADDIDQLVGGVGSVRVALSLGIDDVDTDVVLHNLGHEAVDRPPDGRDQLQRLRAPRLSLESPFEGLDLSPNAADPADQLGFAAAGMAHDRRLP